MVMAILSSLMLISPRATGWLLARIHTSSLALASSVVHLHHDWLVQQHSGITNLLPTAGFNNRRSGGGGLQRRWLVVLAGASGHKKRDGTNSDEQKLHFFIDS